MHVSPVISSDEQQVHYPEWDQRTEMLRENWVTVIDVPVPRSMRFQNNLAPGRAVDRRLAFGPRARLLDRAVRLRRQHEGEELDLDAAIESRISARGRIMPDPRIFKRPGRRRRHLTVLLLLDLSESTNDRIGGSFTSVLDLEKQAANILADSVDPGRDRIAIDGFASNGRSEVRYTHIKDFNEPYGEEQRQYLLGQRGSLSTRMGAALRHAGTQLKAEHGEKKVLLVVTDGEPSDIDVADRAYLVEDARHAVAALNVRGIDTFCLTLDKRADAYVRTIFGAWNFLIVDNPVSLPFQVGQALEKVAAR
jgi:nitric oxide reductase NorD protein